MILKQPALVLLFSLSLHAQAIHAGRNVFRPVTNNWGFDLQAGDAGTIGQDNILLLNSINGGGNGNYGPGISFGFPTNALVRRYASLVSVQTSADPDQIGLAFITHPSATTSGALVEQLRITHDGKVGIGTTTPGVALHIFDPVPNIRMQDSAASNSVAAGAFFEFWHQTARFGWMGFGSSNNDDFSIANESPGGHVLLDPGAGGDLKLFGTDHDFFTQGEGWQEFTTTIVGVSSTTVREIWYKRVGKTVFVNFHISGTSNSTNFSFTLPFINTNNGQVEVMVAARVQNSGAFLAIPGMAFLAVNSSTVSIFRDFGGAIFSNTGTKSVQGQLWYQTP